jgi:hypothetical protein
MRSLLPGRAPARRVRQGDGKGQTLCRHPAFRQPASARGCPNRCGEGVALAPQGGHRRALVPTAPRRGRDRCDAHLEPTHETQERGRSQKGGQIDPRRDHR